MALLGITASTAQYLVGGATITWAVEDGPEQLDTEELQRLSVQGVEPSHQLPHRGQATQLQELLKRPAGKTTSHMTNDVIITTT